ncbi:DUF1924 domain-containing protein [Candidatus Thiodiazotropha sp. LNASS1]|uniref:DUF1924 domain-containing protein n=1 Tax=Candidatus Thiodiazotropha sp. LNASS1 TaxID=3096260 RepID=UPI00347A5C44
MKSILFSLLFLSTAVLQANNLDNMFESFQASGAGPFSAEQGRDAWVRAVIDKKSGKPRSCSDCHGEDLSKAGKHIKTGKRIEPMAPSANAKRLSDPKKINKWFKRNCKWTWGRVCTPQEKGDLLLYLQKH